MGNASACISRLRREKITASFNKSLLPLAQEDKDFTETSPHLFGPDFAKRSKDHLDQVKALRTSTSQQEKPFFQGGPPPSWGGASITRRAEVEPPTTGGARAKTGPNGLPNKDRTHRHTELDCSLSFKSFSKKYNRGNSKQGHSPHKLSAGPDGQTAVLHGLLESYVQGLVDLETVQGYPLELVSEPHQVRRPQPPHYNQHQNKVILKEIQKLLQKGAVMQVEPQEEGFYSTLFLVPKKDGGQRPVINLKALNGFIHTCHFKMEGIHTLKELIKPRDWLKKVDLKDAYFMILICQDYRRLLHFAFQENLYASRLASHRLHGSLPRPLKRCCWPQGTECHSRTGVEL